MSTLSPRTEGDGLHLPWTGQVTNSPAPGDTDLPHSDQHKEGP